MKKYHIKEMYYTIQGEGRQSGRPAVFVRFSGCNLWSGLEKDRAGTICKFCDTNFWGTDGINGGKYDVQELIEQIEQLYTADYRKMVVLTGGEPALQVDEELVAALHEAGFFIAIETNGTKTLPIGIDWICVSPKANTDIIVRKGHELKLVYPQDEHQPEDFITMDFDYFYLQPKEDGEWVENTAKTVAYVKSHPQWTLSVQTHKYLNIP